jgi:hypothetical protein
MCKWVDKTNYLLDPFREDDECWFHPSPPPAQVSTNGIARPCGKLQKRFDWKDRQGKHSLVLNFGIACKLVNYKMTKQQKDGFIQQAVAFVSSLRQLDLLESCSYHSGARQCQHQP